MAAMFDHMLQDSVQASSGWYNACGYYDIPLFEKLMKARVTKHVARKNDMK